MGEIVKSEKCRGPNLFWEISGCRSESTKIFILLVLELLIALSREGKHDATWINEVSGAQSIIWTFNIHKEYKVDLNKRVYHEVRNPYRSLE